MDDWIPDDLGRLDLQSLIGLDVARARTLVEEAGGRLLAVHRDHAIGLPYSPGLVTVMIGDDEVTSVVGLQGRRAGDYVPEALASLDLNSLVGAAVADARARVHEAGGELHVLTSWNAPFDVRPWRITVELAAGRVVKVIGNFAVSDAICGP